MPSLPMITRTMFCRCDDVAGGGRCGESTFVFMTWAEEDESFSLDIYIMLLVPRLMILYAANIMKVETVKIDNHLPPKSAALILIMLALIL